MDALKETFDHLNDLEWALKTSPTIQQKCQEQPEYRNKLYHALCNIEWQRNNAWIVLKDMWWSCTWRYAGGLVAEIYGQGNYRDYYLWRPSAQDLMLGTYNFSGPVDPEIAHDLGQLGFYYREME